MILKNHLKKLKNKLTLMFSYSILKTNSNLNRHQWFNAIEQAAQVCDIFLIFFNLFFYGMYFFFFCL